MNDLAGIPIVTHWAVPEGKIFVVNGSLHTHSRRSERTKWRRPHGRTNGPRKRRTKYVTYSPDLDRVMAMVASV